jgi:peptide/nickel transport system ATP-binding protein/oligopeptide transport system ATP-binding protein
LDVRDLQTYFFTDAGVAKAVERVSFRLEEGQTLALVGESGCGKSVTALSIMGLIPQPPGRVVGGEIRLDGTELLGLSERQLRDIRGNRISMIFQEPMTSLNPVLRVGEQIAEAVLAHQRVSKRTALERSVEMLRLVGIPSPETRVRDYPHQMSGGMRQRVMIGIALACNPRLLIADEPTTALDVTIQAQILEFMDDLRDRTGTSVLLITHDLGVVAETTHHVVVMYAGRVVEEAPVTELFEKPLHPYTQGLMRSIPRTDDAGGERLEAIEGLVPSLLALPPGCTFNNRCPHAFDRCCADEPTLLRPSAGRAVRCWLY